MKPCSTVPLSSYRMLTALVALGILASTASGFAVYDCEDLRSTITAVDLYEPEPCPDPERDYFEPENRTVQILQTNAEVPIAGYQCTAKLSKTVTRCGYNSITYGTTYPVREQHQDFTAEECLKAAKEGKIEVDDEEYEVQLGERYQTTFFSHGSVEASSGACTTESFVSGGVAYDYSYEVTEVEISVRTIRGIANPAEDTVVLANGLRGKYSDQSLSDAFEGTMVWETRDLPCQSTVSGVYLGLAQMFRKRDERTASGAIVLVESPETSQYLGLTLKEPVLVCGQYCYRTHIKGLSLCLLEVHEKPMFGKPGELAGNYAFQASFDQTTIGRQSALSYHHITTNQHVNQRFMIVQADLCRVERMALFGKLQALAGADNPYALLDLFGPGYTVTVAGAAAYVTQCARVEAVRADYPNCTREVPVRINGTLAFADPLTWTLSRHPTVIVCSDAAPARWKLDGIWYCAYPNTVECKPPMQLKPKTQALKTWDFTRGLGLNTFSPDQQLAHREFQRVQSSRAAVVAKITNAAAGTRGHNDALGIPLDAQDLKQVTNAVGNRFMPLFSLFGDWYYVAFQVFITIALIKTFVGCLIRTSAMYQERGCGPWLLGALWSTLFTMLRTPVQILTNATSEAVSGFDHNPPPAPLNQRRPRRNRDDDVEMQATGDQAPAVPNRGGVLVEAAADYFNLRRQLETNSSRRRTEGQRHPMPAGQGAPEDGAAGGARATSAPPEAVPLLYLAPPTNGQE